MSCLAARTGRELIEHCQQFQPELVVSDIKMPDLDGIDAAEEIYRNQPIPIILISDLLDADLVQRASHQHIIMACLVKPIKDTDLGPTITIAWERFREFETLRQETIGLKQSLEDRTIIDRAKGIIMRHTGLAEPEAFRRLQKSASSRSIKLIEIATMIVAADEAAANGAGEKEAAARDV